MRKTDDPNETKRYFRASGRTLQMNGGWFFATREGDVGPFPTQAAADAELKRFVDERVALSGFQDSRCARAESLAARLAKAQEESSIPTLELVPL